ncbi:MAG TPA: adenylate/guanylate cyclase domain-containing protein [Nocardioidaceae bacterium]|nr:adenylate/guanylate cyclase domain-containing protein [Nocardioidaceae bacterium]
MDPYEPTNASEPGQRPEEMSGSEPSSMNAGEPSREELERAILGAEPELTAQQVADAAGVSRDDAQRLWQALGFPDAGDAVAFTADDLDALRTVHRAIDGGEIDAETATRLTRAVGHTMARLADWQVSTLAEHVEGRAREGTSRLASALDLSQTVAPAFEELLVYAWRRHLAAAVSRIEALGAAEEDLLAAELTVGFADLVSFTQLTNGLDDDELAALVERFETRCGDVVTARGGRVIKTLGDSILFVADKPAEAVEIALGVVDEIGPDADLPDVRIGLASGTVITRFGDVFGPPVNLASRLTTVARRNRVIADRATADALPEESFDTRALPPRSLRGFGSVEPITVRRRWPY